MPGKKRKAKQPDTRTTSEKMKAMIQGFADTCNVVRAAKLARISRKIHYVWLEKHPDYAAVFEKTKRHAADYLESVAVERATTGWSEGIYYQGSRCGSVRRYSDGLLMLLLRGAKPELYGNKTEISGPQGTPIQATIKVVLVRPGEVPRDE